jgi:hypothetical protein
MVISDPGLCKMIKDRSPSTDVYYRWVTSDHDAGPFDSPDPRTWTSGRLWFDYMWARHSQATGADYHQLYNECSFGGNTQDAAYAVAVNTFEMQMMERATQVGVKVTIGNYMPGVPEALHIERLRPAFDMAEKQGHVLCYHAYSSVRHDSDFTADSFQTLVESVLDEFFHVRLRQEAQLPALKYPIDDLAFSVKSLLTRSGELAVEGFVEPIRLFFLDESNQVHAEESMYDLFLLSGLHYVIYVLQHVAVLAEGLNDKELAKETDVFDEYGEQGKS